RALSLGSRISGCFCCPPQVEIKHPSSIIPFRRHSRQSLFNGPAMPSIVLALLLCGPVRAQSGGQERAAVPEYSAELVAQLVVAARSSGDARRGAAVFRAPQFACISCHKVGSAGGTVGPDLSKIGLCSPPEKIVESVLWPKREVKKEFVAF